MTTPEATSSDYPERPGLHDGVSGEFLVMTTLKPGQADALRAWFAAQEADPNNVEQTRAAIADIGTLHDSRFAIFDNDTRLLFASVFDGSWDTYIDDFATTIIAQNFDKVWSFTEGFPGIGDPNVKEWFVAHQVPASNFASAYPDLTTVEIWKNQDLNEAFQAVLDTPEFQAALKDPANAALLATPAFQKLLDIAAG